MSQTSNSTTFDSGVVRLHRKTTITNFTKNSNSEWVETRKTVTEEEYDEFRPPTPPTALPQPYPYPYVPPQYPTVTYGDPK